MKSRGIISVLLLSLCITSFCGCNKVDEVKDKVQNFDVSSVAQDIGNQVTAGIDNVKDSALNYINKEVENFMTEHNIPKDKAGEVMKLAKEWAKTALTVSGEIDKTKGSLKQYLSDHLDDLGVSEDSSQASKK